MSNKSTIWSKNIIFCVGKSCNIGENLYICRRDYNKYHIFNAQKSQISTMKRIHFLALFALVLLAACGKKEPLIIAPCEIWPDNTGVHVNAHGGGILEYNGTYYWFGENKSDTTSSAMVGVDVYSSKDLVNWTNEGVALAVSDDPESDITRGCVLERPKVIYNKKTGKFVMWFHLELKGRGYSAARAGVAVSDSPTGPYEFIRSGRVNPGIWPIDLQSDEAQAKLAELDYFKYDERHNPQAEKWWTPEWRADVEAGLMTKRDLEGGQMARDMQLFVDTDGKAYHIYSAEENLTLNIAELSDDYLSHSGKYVRVAPAGHNEAPALFKKGDTYWMITSGCTGWAPNAARMFSAPNIMGPWTQYENPCRGEKAEITYGGQSTYILPYGDNFIFMADIWRPKHPSDARYLWLPIQFDENSVPFLEFMEKWDLNTFAPVVEAE